MKLLPLSSHLLSYHVMVNSVNKHFSASALHAMPLQWHDGFGENKTWFLSLSGS